jgi:hypothetical protein
MSADDVEIVRDMYTAFGQRDRAALRERVAPT